MAGLLAGVDLGGTSIKTALADESGRVVSCEVIPTESHQGPDAVLARIADAIQRLLSNISNESSPPHLLGVGMGVPGLVDVQTGTTKFLPNLPTQWRDVPVAATLSKRLGSPVRLLNDVRTATLGELRFGLG
jgi:glucokinase